MGKTLFSHWLVTQVSSHHHHTVWLVFNKEIQCDHPLFTNTVWLSISKKYRGIFLYLQEHCYYSLSKKHIVIILHLLKQWVCVCLSLHPLGWAHSLWRFLGPQLGLLFSKDLARLSARRAETYNSWTRGKSACILYSCCLLVPLYKLGMFYFIFV